MKKTSKTKLTLSSETVRSLERATVSPAELAAAAGGEGRTIRSRGTFGASCAGCGECGDTEVCG